MDHPHIYLDYAATTPLEPQALEAMLPYFRQYFGNPSSVHRWGQQAEAAVEEARARMAGLLGCQAQEIIFTSCGTESDNLALRGIAYCAREARRNHILTTPVEHHAVLTTAQDLAAHHGFELELLPVDRHGRVDPDELEARIRPQTAIVSIIYANNEIGTVNDLPALAAVCRRHGVPLHTDAVQAASQLPIDVTSLGVDLMSIGAHKFYGPKGIGALYVRAGVALWPVQTGGAQEAGRRAGTHNVPLIVGMAKALEITASARSQHNAHYQRLRDRLLAEIPARIPDVQVTGHPKERLPNHASFALRGVEANRLLAALDLAGFACSSGSACKTGSPEPSEALLALGYDSEWAMGSLRITVGRPTKLEQVEALIEQLPAIVQRLRRAEAGLP